MYSLYRPEKQLPSKLDIKEVLNEITQLLDSQTSYRNLKIKMDFSADIPTLYLPEAQVRQVLYNVLLNAVQASESGGNIDIAVFIENGSVHTAVKDNGTGIAEDVLPHIFDPFFSTKKKHEGSGMGLGLSVSYNLVQAMGGEIEVDTSPGKGSTFTVVLPLPV